MTARQVLLAWLAVPLAVLAALLVGNRFVPASKPRFAQADVAVIGSSLMAHALPERDTTGNGRLVRRIGIALPDESELLALIDEAIEQRVPVIVIEAAPWIADFRLEPEQACKAPAGSLRQSIHTAQVALVDQLRRLFGLRTSLDGMGEPVNLDRPQSVNPADIRRFYPLKVHRPCRGAQLAAAVARARAQGSRVVLVLMPRAPLGEKALGPRQALELRLAANNLAESLDLDLFEPVGPWPDSLFVDHAHLGSRGRTQFRRELISALGVLR